MFSVLFEVHPRSDRWDAYLGYARMLRPELEQIEGFVDNIRYESLTREGWLLSLSGWRDEKALVRWRTRANHHDVQEKGRGEVFRDYHLRVGQVTRDTRPPDGSVLQEQRLDETETGEGTTVTLIDARRPPEWVKETGPAGVATWLGLAPRAPRLVAWDVFHAVLTPGDVILLVSWRDQAAAESFESALSLQEGARLRRVRVVRDYGMFDRREAPQYYPDVRTELLFSYGTLQLEAVQMATFGRRLAGTSDALSGFELGLLDIDDPAVVAISGTAQHTMATFTGRASDLVPGAVFAVTPDELQHADKYEVAAVKRVAVVLQSGARAWAYVDARSSPPRLQ